MKTRSGWACRQIHMRKMRLIAALATLAVLASRPPAASARCSFDWKPGEGVPGVSQSVLAMTTWDPDGPGPQSELLVVGGTFTVAGASLANHIAAWNGTTW